MKRMMTNRQQMSVSHTDRFVTRRGATLLALCILLALAVMLMTGCGGTDVVSGADMNSSAGDSGEVPDEGEAAGDEIEGLALGEWQDSYMISERDDKPYPVKVRFTADGKTVAEAVFDPKPGAPDWNGVKYYPEWKIHQGSYTGVTAFDLPQGARRLAVEVVSGDWIDIASLAFTASDGRTAELNVRKDWASPQNFRQVFAGFGAQVPFVSADAPARPRRYADAGREYLYRRMIEPWEEALANGTFVMAGEFGVWKMTPHDIVLDVFEDYLALWKERNMGWALWNLRGSIGILDSERADVEYEDYEGHKLDRKMLELLQRY